MKKLILFAGLYCMLPGLFAATTIKSNHQMMAPVSASERAKAHFKENYADGAERVDVVYCSLTIAYLLYISPGKYCGPCIL